MYLSGAINVTTVHRQCSTRIKEKPQFNALSRVFCRHNKFSIASIHHDSVALNSLQRELINLADGNRDVQQITTALSKIFNDNEKIRADYNQMLESFRQNNAMHDTNNVNGITPAFVQQAITNLAYLGLLDN
ncbi:hypothetical protein [Kaarinaea lacus]